MDEARTKDAQAMILVSGLVQGVYFRANTQKQALQLGLNGYAKNLADGRVEVLARGEQANIEKLIAWCHQGPSAARVSQVQVQWQSAGFQQPDFQIC